MPLGREGVDDGEDKGDVGGLQAPRPVPEGVEFFPPGTELPRLLGRARAAPDGKNGISVT